MTFSAYHKIFSVVLCETSVVLRVTILLHREPQRRIYGLKVKKHLISNDFRY